MQLKLLDYVRYYYYYYLTCKDNRDKVAMCNILAMWMLLNIHAKIPKWII